MPRLLWQSVLSVLLGLFLCVSFVSYSHSAILGVDLGSEYIKIASVQPGKSFHIVLDEQAKRKVPAVLSFDEGERFFGAAALQLAIKRPKETFQFAIRLLGQSSVNSPAIQQLRAAGFHYDFVELTERNAVGVRFVEENGKELIFSPEEILAMLLQYAVRLGEADAQQPITDVVLTVPPFWTQKERQALLDAAEIANINVLSLVNENTAAAIQYGIDRKYSNENDSHTVIFYNMGASSTKVSLVTYSAYLQKEKLKKNNKVIGQFETRATAYDETLGGQAFEAKITEFLATEVNAQLKKRDPANAIDVHTNARVMAKIRAAADKAKIILSANKETPVSLVSLYNDMDFKVAVTREKFYELSADLLARASLPLKSVLEESGLTSKQVDSVIIIGGGVRIPGIQQELKKFLKREDLAQNLNGDECFALGALFRAANLSTAFQVRQFGVNDLTPFGVGVKLIELQNENEVLESLSVDKEKKSSAIENEEEKDEEPLLSADMLTKRASLFKRWNRLNKRKMVAFSHNRDFSAYLYHDDKYFPSSVFHPAIAHYNISGLSELVSDPKNEQLLKLQKPKVSLSFLLDNSGIVALTKAEATLEETIKVAVPKAKVKKNESAEKVPDNKEESATDAATAAEEGKKNEEKNPEESNSQTASASNSESASSASSSEASSETSADSAASSSNSTSNSTAEEEAEVEYVNRKKLHTFPLKLSRGEFSGTFIPLNSSSILQARQRLTFFQKRDELRREIQGAKNTLESFIYSSRNELYDDEYQSVSTEEQREEIKNLCEQTENWLYEPKPENDKEILAVYKSKLTDLKKFVDPIKLRISEQHDRPQALNTSKTLLDFCKKQVEEYKEKRPWVKADDLEKLTKLIEDAEIWLNSKEEEQNGKAPHETLAVTSLEILGKLKPIAKLSQELMQQKKPVEKKEKKEDKDKKDGTKKENSTENTAGSEETEKEKDEKPEEQSTGENVEQESQSQSQTHEHPDL